MCPSCKDTFAVVQITKVTIAITQMQLISCRKKCVPCRMRLTKICVVYMTVTCMAHCIIAVDAARWSRTS